MEIDCLVLGDYQTNCYVLRESTAAKDCLIIDTGLQADELIDFLRMHKLNPLVAVLTHGHADHIVGLAALRENYPDIKVYIHKLDAKLLTKPMSNLSIMSGKFFKTAPAEFLIDDGDVIEQAGINLEVLHTPGHTPGGICLYSRESGTLFSGDTLFADSVGRTDLPGGNMEQLIKGIKEKLWLLPGDTIVYPGHGPETTIAQEKTYNQYIQ